MPSIDSKIASRILVIKKKDWGASFLFGDDIINKMVFLYFEGGFIKKRFIIY